MAKHELVVFLRPRGGSFDELLLLLCSTMDMGRREVVHLVALVCVSARPSLFLVCRFSCAAERGKKRLLLVAVAAAVLLLLP